MADGEVKMFDYDAVVLGTNPQNLVIFLHGYNGTVADHQYALDWLAQYLKNAVLIVPHAPEISDKNPQRFQWFGMLQYDAANRRAQPETTTAEIFAIYNSAARDMDSRAAQINEFIDAMQTKYGTDDTHTFLCGFSQGAMLTIYAALTRRATLGGAFVLSGLVAGADLLNTKITVRPPLYMFHGRDDMKVQFKTLAESEKWLQARNIPLQIKTYADLAHRMTEEEIAEVAAVINQTA